MESIPRHEQHTLTPKQNQTQTQLASISLGQRPILAHYQREGGSFNVLNVAEKKRR